VSTNPAISRRYPGYIFLNFKFHEISSSCRHPGRLSCQSNGTKSHRHRASPKVKSVSRGSLRRVHGFTVFCSLAVLDPRVGHTVDVLSPFISVLCRSDRLFHGQSCPRLDVDHPGRAWSSGIVPCIISFSRQLPCFLMV